MTETRVSPVKATRNVTSALLADDATRRRPPLDRVDATSVARVKQSTDAGKRGRGANKIASCGEGGRLSSFRIDLKLTVQFYYRTLHVNVLTENII